MKKASIVCVMCCAIALETFVARRAFTRVLFSNISPNKHYRVDITQCRRLPFFEIAAFLNAHRDGEPLVNRKLLYTGDFLEPDFSAVYANPRFRSESIHELGSVDLGNESQKERAGDLRILNETSRYVAYILIETGWYKLVAFDIKARAKVDLSFHYSVWLSCQGQFANSQDRVADAVAIEDAGNLSVKRQFVVRIRQDTATIESPQQGLRQTTCCASNRPDPDHERLY